jgi:signal transduction histidine kinase
VLREGLSNVARHSGATKLTVDVWTDAQSVRVRIIDNGTGLPEGAVRSGLNNLATRARDLRGTFSAVALAAPERGTAVEWSVPLGDSVG